MPKTEMILYGSAGLYLLIKIIRGWQLGPMRQVVNLTAIIIAWLAWRAYGGEAGAMLEFTGLPQIALIPLGSLVLAITVYLIVKAIGAFLFRKTTDQPLGVFWLISGTSGAALGVLTGGILLFLGAIGIRFLGAFAEGVSGIAPPAETPPAIVEEPQPATSPATATATPAPAAPLSVSGVGSHLVTRFLIESKASLEKGWTGTLLYFLDPLPESTYQMAFKSGRALSTPLMLTRFANDPRITNLLNHPQFLALQNNEKLLEAARDKRFVELLRDPDIVKALDQPEILELLKSLPLQEILNSVVPDPAPSASPTPTPTP